MSDALQPAEVETSWNTPFGFAGAAVDPSAAMTASRGQTSNMCSFCRVRDFVFLGAASAAKTNTSKFEVVIKLAGMAALADDLMTS